MSDPVTRAEGEVAYADGEFVPADEAAVPLAESGLVLYGYSVYDTMRTVGHDLHRAEAHVERFFDSCRAAEIDLDADEADVLEATRGLVERNARDLPDGDDLMVSVQALGDFETYPVDGGGDASLWIRSAPIPFAHNAWKFLEGARLVTTRTRQSTNDTVPPSIKHVSRMHLVLAAKEAERVDPKADPLLLDADGNVTESKHANVFVVDDGAVWTPPARKVLPGVSRATTIEIARDLGFTVREEDLVPYDVYTADEVFYTNTSHAVAPVTRVDGREVGDGTPGEVTEALLSAHGDRAGIDIVEQYLEHLPPGERPGTLRLGGEDGTA